MEAEIANKGSKIKSLNKKSWIEDKICLKKLKKQSKIENHERRQSMQVDQMDEIPESAEQSKE